MMKRIEFIYQEHHDMSHMVRDFCKQCELSFGHYGNRKFIDNQNYTLIETPIDSDWYRWGFVKTVSGPFGTDGTSLYTGICITEEHATEVLLIVNGPNFIKIK